jgi:hypothetical protein
MSHYADHAFEQSALADRRGEEIPDHPVCMHIHGCHEHGTALCDCGEYVCKKHIYVCAEGDCALMVCDGCSLESVFDSNRRCLSCAQQHSEIMKRRVLVA